MAMVSTFFYRMSPCALVATGVWKSPLGPTMFCTFTSLHRLQWFDVFWGKALKSIDYAFQHSRRQGLVFPTEHHP